MGSLHRIDHDLWVVDAPLAFMGLPVGTRMTVMRLADKRLLLHSPVEATKSLQERVSELGDVAFLVAPNRFHHLFVGSWQQACPGAKTLVAPGLERKRPDLAVDGVLGDEPPPDWHGLVDPVVVAGLPLLSEVVFFHRPSASLLLTDLAFNFRRDAPLPTRMAIHLIGKLGQLAPTLLERLATRDRAALGRSLRRILEFPFERIIVTHGDIVEHGGREQLQENFAWALRSGGAEHEC